MEFILLSAGCAVAVCIILALVLDLVRTRLKTGIDH